MAEYYYVLAAPLLPGGLEKWKKMVNEIKGPRKNEYQAARKKMGIKHERVWLQQTAQGEFTLVSFEGTDTSKVLEKFLKSQDPFDKWFARTFKRSTDRGIGNPPSVNELYLDIL